MLLLNRKQKFNKHLSKRKRAKRQRRRLLLKLRIRWVQRRSQAKRLTLQNRLRQVLLEELLSTPITAVLSLSFLTSMSKLRSSLQRVAALSLKRRCSKKTRTSSFKTIRVSHSYSHQMKVTFLQTLKFQLRLQSTTTSAVNSMIR